MQAFRRGLAALAILLGCSFAAHAQPASKPANEVKAPAKTGSAWTNNRVTLYNNGIASFSRNVKLKGGEVTTVSLPIKQEHAGDVLASLVVLGKVEIVEPASFSSGTDQDVKLEINTGSIIESLASALSGSEIAVQRSGGQAVKGTLAGLDTQSSGSGGQRKFMVIQTADGLVRVNLDEITSFQFPDPTVQAEINRALQRNYRKLNPQATVVRLKLRAAADGEATLQYTVPIAAWKMAYRLRQLPGDRFELEGHAVVSNNTAEDWDGFEVSVVTGQPITFSTDLAFPRVPARRHVNVAPDQAFGNVQAEAAMAAPTGFAPRPQSRVAGVAADSSPALESAPLAAASVASAPRVSVAEVADFSMFKAENPVSILANHSADIPVFRTELDKSSAVLFYKSRENAERAFRAVKFTNNAKHSLGKGVCTIYLEGGVYAGSAIIESAKSGEERVLVHALETGLQVKREQRPIESRRVSIAFNGGVVTSQLQLTGTTSYSIKNLAKEKMQLLVDHDSVVPGSKITVEGAKGEVESLKSGNRVSFSVDAEQELVVKVVETKVVAESVKIGNGVAELNEWVQINIVNARHPLTQDEGLKKAVAVHAKLQGVVAKLNEEAQLVATLEARQESLRKNLTAAGENAPNRAEWLKKLSENQTRIEESQEKTQPALRESQKQLTEELRQALTALSAQWNEGK